jgi:hypothetical protein
LKTRELPTGYKVSFEQGIDHFHGPLRHVDEYNSRNSSSAAEEGQVSEVQVMNMKKIFSYVTPSQKQKLKLNNKTFGGSLEEDT